MERKILKTASVFFAVLAVFSFIANDASGETALYLKFKLPDETKGITALAFGPESEKIVYGNEKGLVFIVDIATGTAESLPGWSGHRITAIDYSGDGRQIAFASKDKKIFLLDLQKKSGPVELKGSKGRLDAVRFSADGRYIAAAGEDKTIYIWEVPSMQFRSGLKGHKGGILELAFDDESGLLISIGRDKRMIIWDTASMRSLRQVELDARTISNSGIDVTSAKISADRTIAAAGIDEHILEKGGRKMIFKYHLAFFDIAKGLLLKILEDNEKKIESIGLYPGNCYAAFDNSTLQKKRLALRNIESGSFDLDYPLGGGMSGIQFSPDGKWLAAAVQQSKDEKQPHLYLWEVEYEMPASGCFSGRIRLNSAKEPLLYPGENRIAAVLPFGTSGADPETGMAAAHFLENALAESTLRLIERANISDILAELKLQQSGMVDRESAVEIGKLLGATHIITGNIDRAGTDLIVSARIIDVSTGEILGVKEVHCGQCGNDDLYDAIDRLAPALVAF
ncbi:MAG: hypothetical protein JW746_01375 [Candidatus Krumholzibacteriota bacterium]|nr:hypothetical protein [Candidatus Krumholzibacteriota bacterium]